MKNKKGRVYSGQGPTLLLWLSQPLRPSFLSRELIRAVSTTHFQVLQRRWRSQGEDKGQKPGWTHRAPGRVCPRVPAGGTHRPGQALLMPPSKRGGRGKVKPEEREQSAWVRRDSFKPNLKSVMGMLTTIGERLGWNTGSRTPWQLIPQPAWNGRFHSVSWVSAIF